MFKNNFLKGTDRFIFSISFVIAIVIYTASGFYIGFQMALNDFWGVLYYAKHLSLTQLPSLYNGFFPIGYAFILSLIPYGYVTRVAYVLNILVAGLFVSCLTLFFFTMKGSKWGALPVFIATAFYPLVYHYANAVSPDIGMAAFTLAGTYLLWKDEFLGSPSQHQTRNDILAGFLLGLSALFRSHGIISSVAVLFSFAVVMGVRRLWARKTVLITLILTFLIQVSVNLISGHGPLETAQNFTAYITFYGMDWWRIPPDVYHFSVIAQFFKDPGGFIRLFIPLFLNLVVYAVPSLLCVFILQASLEKRFAWFTMLSIVVYSIPVAIGTSATSRGPFPILGLAILCVCLLTAELLSRGRKIVGSSKPLGALALGLLAILALWISYNWFAADLRFLEVYRAQNQAFRTVETRLLHLGLKAPREAFTNKFGLYFPDTPPYRPYSNGGWEDFSMWNYRQEFPEMPTDSWENFIAAASAQKIKFLVLSPGTGLVSDFLGNLYSGDFQPAEVSLVAKVGNTKIYKLKGN